MEGGDVLFMMLLGTLGFESFGGRQVLFEGIKVGRRTAVEVRDENRVRLTKTVRLILLSRFLSLMSIKDTRIRGVAILKTPRIACTAMFDSSSARSQTCIILFRARLVEALGRL